MEGTCVESCRGIVSHDSTSYEASNMDYEAA